MPGGAIVGESAEGSSCQGSHTSLPETVQGHEAKIGGHGPKFERTPTQATGIWVVRASSLSERRLLESPGVV